MPENAISNNSNYASITRDTGHGYDISLNTTCTHVPQFRNELGYMKKTHELYIGMRPNRLSSTFDAETDVVFNGQPNDVITVKLKKRPMTLSEKVGLYSFATIIAGGLFSAVMLADRYFVPPTLCNNVHTKNNSYLCPSLKDTVSGNSTDLTKRVISNSSAVHQFDGNITKYKQNTSHTLNDAPTLINSTLNEMEEENKIGQEDDVTNSTNATEAFKDTEIKPRASMSFTA